MPELGLGLSLRKRRMLGGVSPTDVSGLSLWLDFADRTTLYTDSGSSLVASSGDVVGQSNDKSGSGNHFRQTDGTKKGLYLTNQKNGLSILRTDGVNDFLQCISSANTFKFLHTGGSTIFMVLKVGLVSSPNTLYWLLDNVTNAGSIGSRAGYYIRYDDRSGSGYSDSYVHIIAGGGNAPVLNSANDRAPALSWVQNSVISDPANATAANRSYIRKNGLDPIQNNTNTFAVSSLDPSYPLTLGAAAGDGGNPAPVDWCELLIYNRVLPDSERLPLGVYLRTKWDIAA